MTGKSILFELKSVNFPDSFTLDMMHLLYENIPAYMFKYWYGIFFANDMEKTEEYILSKHTWDIIGKQMENARKTMPTDFG